MRSRSGIREENISTTISSEDKGHTFEGQRIIKKPPLMVRNITNKPTNFL